MGKEPEEGFTCLDDLANAVGSGWRERSSRAP
jgi:hypothetical protein